MTKPNFLNVQNIFNEDNLKWKMTSNGRLHKVAEFDCLDNHVSNSPSNGKLTKIANFESKGSSNLLNTWRW